MTKKIRSIREKITGVPEKQKGSTIVGPKHQIPPWGIGCPDNADINVEELVKFLEKLDERISIIEKKLSKNA